MEKFFFLYFIRRSSFEKLKFYCNEKLVSLILMDSLLSYFSLKSEAARVLCCLLENRSSDELLCVLKPNFSSSGLKAFFSLPRI